MNARQKKQLDAWARRGLELEIQGLEPGVIGNPERIKRLLRNARAVASRRRVRRTRKP